MLIQTRGFGSSIQRTVARTWLVASTSVECVFSMTLLFGPALVVNTTQRSGGYILGFRVDPAEKLKDIFKEIDSLFQVGPGEYYTPQGELSIYYSGELCVRIGPLFTITPMPRVRLTHARHQVFHHTAWRTVPAASATHFEPSSLD